MTNTPHDHHQHDHGDGAPASTVPAPAGPTLVTLSVHTGSLACEACVSCVEERLRQNPHVTGVHVNTQHEVAHVTVHGGMVTANELAELIAEGCGDRNVVP